MIVSIFLYFLLQVVRGNPTISVYADVFKDQDFFQKTFPWVIEQIGADISVDFNLLGSGRYSIPQMCALRELNRNAFLQAQYLKCEVEGNPSSYCLCETGIDPIEFKECVNEGSYLASHASHKFKMLGIGTTPLIELGPKSTVFEVSAHWYLRKICTIFGNNPPLGCTKTCNSCNNSTEPYLKDVKKPLAQFDKECKIDSDCYNPETTESSATFTTSKYPYTY